VLSDIDVIVPFHKVDLYLAPAIQSVKQSQGVNVRVIAVNDSGILVDANTIGLDANDVLIPADGKGYLAALATGVSNASAPLLAFQDSDDLTHPSRLFKQASMLLNQNLDLVTGNLVRMNSSGKVISTESVFGNLPKFLSPHEKLIFGPHGADSAILGRTSFVKDSWHSHRKFSPSFADYGWLLSIIDKAKIAHENSAVYYYRSHPFQMSRLAKDMNQWNLIFELWLNNLTRAMSKKNGSAEVEEVLIKIDSTLAINIAFPSAFINLDKGAKSDLYEVTRILRNLDRYQDSLESQKFTVLLDRRIFIATRGRDLRYFWVGLQMFRRLLLNQFNGLKPRRGN